MKVVKRVICLILLIVILFAVGYGIKTCNRLKSNIPIEDVKGHAYASKDNLICLVVLEDLQCVYISENEEKSINLDEYKDGILSCSFGDIKYTFSVLTDGNVFDNTSKTILYKGVKHEETENSV